MRAEATEVSGNENVDLEGTLKPYHESEIREIKMFGDVADVTAPRERPARTRQLKNPYLKPRTAADGPKERPAPVGSAAAVERSAGRISEQSEISLIDEAVGQDARSKP